MTTQDPTVESSSVMETPTSSSSGSLTGDDSTGERNSAKYGPDEQITIFQDPDDFTVKHPLASSWTLWFTKPAKPGESWKDLLKEVVTFSTVEEFWAIYQNVMPASQLPVKTDFHLFRTGIPPEWEHPANHQGGKWSYALKGASGPNAKSNIDDVWLNLCLGAIGETLEPPQALKAANGNIPNAKGNKQLNASDITGVVVNIRKGNICRIGIWTRSRDNPENRERLKVIGNRIKEALSLGPQDQMDFQTHDAAEKQGTSRAKSRLQV